MTADNLEPQRTIEGDTLLDVKQAAAYLGMSAYWLAEQARLKRVPHRRLGAGSVRAGKFKFTKGDLDQIIADRKVTPVDDDKPTNSRARRAGKAS